MDMSSSSSSRMTPKNPMLTALILCYFQVGGDGRPVHFAPILAGRATARYTGYVYGFKWRMSKLNTWRWGEKNKENQRPYSYTHKSYLLKKVWDFTVIARWRIKKGETFAKQLCQRDPKRCHCRDLPGSLDHKYQYQEISSCSVYFKMKMFKQETMKISKRHAPISRASYTSLAPLVTPPVELLHESTVHPREEDSMETPPESRGRRSCGACSRPTPLRLLQGRSPVSSTMAPRSTSSSSSTETPPRLWAGPPRTIPQKASLGLSESAKLMAMGSASMLRGRPNWTRAKSWILYLLLPGGHVGEATLTLSRSKEAKSTPEDRKDPRDMSDSTSLLDRHAICGRRQREHVDNTAPMLVKDALCSGRGAASDWDMKATSAHTTTLMSSDTLATPSRLEQQGSQHETTTRGDITTLPTQAATQDQHSECGSFSGVHLSKPRPLGQASGGHGCTRLSPRSSNDGHISTASSPGVATSSHGVTSTVQLLGTRVLSVQPRAIFRTSTHVYHGYTDANHCKETPPGDRQSGGDYSLVRPGAARPGAARPSAEDHHATHDYTSHLLCGASAEATPLRSF